MLVSCQEAPSSQPQPADSVAIDLKTKGKTAKELLCKRWRLTDRLYNNPYPYTAKDTFGITFYEDDTFVFRIDPEWYLDSLWMNDKNKNLIIRGKWKFLSLPTYPPSNPNPSKQICEKEPCIDMPILLETNIDNVNRIQRIFNAPNGHTSVRYLSKDTLCIINPSAMLPPIVFNLVKN